MKKEMKEAKISKAILQNVFKYEVYSAKRIGGTWMFGYNDRNGNRQCLYWQFSMKKPWLIPHKEKEFGKHKIPLSGWLFFYFGKFREKEEKLNAMSNSQNLGNN